MEKLVTKIAIQDCSYIVTALCCQLCDNLVTKLGQPCNKSDISVKLVTMQVVGRRVVPTYYLFYFIFILQNSPYIRITITQQNLHTLNKCHTHNGWNDHTEMKSPITGFQYKTT